jgi:hypothetical protein
MNELRNAVHFADDALRIYCKMRNGQNSETTFDNISLHSVIRSNECARMTFSDFEGDADFIVIKMYCFKQSTFGAVGSEFIIK